MPKSIALPALSFVVFLKQVKCDVGSALGYHYPPPLLPPVQFDEPSTPSNEYLPPIFQDEVRPVPIFPTYLPPVYYPPIGTPPSTLNDDDTVVIPPPTPGTLYQAPTPQMKIINMSCMLESSFKTTFRLDRRNSGSPPPIAENGVEGCVHSESSSTFSVDMEGKKLSECGVRRCTSGSSTRANMCLVVRMPTVKGIKLPEDGLVTLQCTPQDSIVSHTKHISLSPTTSSKGRSTNNGIVATGGSQKNFDSRILLLRKSGKSGNFDQPLQPGSVVLLGEELVLRAIVQDGDGWKFSRMGPVMVRSPNSQKSVTLVEENGCRSAGMHSICPYQPRQMSPLDTLLHFRAFLFQSASRGEDMLLSVRMLGCIHSQDCYHNGVCGDENLLPPLRFKRDAKNDTMDWESQVIFRVQTQEESAKLTIKNPPSSKEFLIMVSMLGLCLFGITVLFGVYFKRKNTQQWN